MTRFKNVGRRWLGGLVAALLFAGLAPAHGFPDRPVTLMVPFPAGGLSDVVARNLNGSLARQFGQPVIVELVEQLPRRRSFTHRPTAICYCRQGPANSSLRRWPMPQSNSGARISGWCIWSALSILPSWCAGICR